MNAVGSNVSQGVTSGLPFADLLRQWVEDYARGCYTDVMRAYGDWGSDCAAALANHPAALEAVGWSLALTKRWDVYASLRRALVPQSHGKPETGAFLNLFDAWQAVQEGRYDAALHLARTVSGTSIDSTPRLLGHALKVEGVALFRLGRYGDSETRLRQALDIFQIIGSPIHASQCATNLGLVLNARGEIQAARESLQRALDALVECGAADERIAVASENLAIAEVHLGHLASARTLYHKALQLFEHLQLRAESIAALNGLGHCARLQGEFETAARFHQRGLAIAQNDLPRKACLCHEFLGQIAFDTGQYPQAALHYEQALAIAASIAPDGDLMVEVSWRYAELQVVTGRLEEARVLLERAEKLCADSHDRRELGCVRRVRARLLTAQGQYEAAQDEFRAAVLTLETAGRPFEAALCWIAAADAAGSSGHREHDFLEKAREALAALGDSVWLQQVESRLGGLGAALAPSGPHDCGFVTRDLDMVHLLSTLPKVSRTPFPVLLEGESGTGKELLARAVHRASQRAGEFVAVNCAALPRDLFESELFGHRRGAFSGAQVEKTGLFELADGGTLLLDEIGDMPLEMQTKLLRVLDDGEVRRVGDTHARPVQVKIVAATNRSLSEATQAGRFRVDLFHRLAVHHLRVKALRDRPADMEPLVRHLIDENQLETLRPHIPSLLAELAGRDWPGNVRELRNELVRRATQQALNSQPLRPAAVTLRSTRAHHERQAIHAALTTHQGNVAAAAKQLGMHSTTLRRKMRRLQIDRIPFQSTDP